MFRRTYLKLDRQKVEEYISSRKLPYELTSRGLGDYYPVSRHADAVLLGPQIGYYKEEVEKRLGVPVGVISSRDYALANAKEILALAETVAKEKRPARPDETHPRRQPICLRKHE